MNTLLIHNARILTEHRLISHGWLLVEDGRIAAVSEGNPPDSLTAPMLDAQGSILAPGFVDVHVHGALGVETMDATQDALQTMSRFFAQNGVTSYLPTTLTASGSAITNALHAIRDHVDDGTGATILGAHLEGPYLNVEKCGAQHPQHIRLAERDEAMEWLDLGVIRLAAVAPELKANHWFIRECVRRGIAVSIAHTSATYEQAVAAFDMGISQVTHTYNAMTPLHHRDPGVVGAALADERVICEIICDLLHVHTGAIRTLVNARGSDHIAIITDAMAAAGMPDGEYALGDHTVTKRGGRVTLADGTLAGSVARYNDTVRNMMQVTGKPFTDIWRMTSLTPARAIHQSHLRGSIAIGKIADLIVVDDAVQVEHVVVGGKQWKAEKAEEGGKENANFVRDS